MVRVLETQTVSPNSIPLPLHVILELNKHTLTLPCLVSDWASGTLKKTQKLAIGQQDVE